MISVDLAVGSDQAAQLAGQSGERRRLWRTRAR
jgi:hypothetical protein